MQFGESFDYVFVSAQSESRIRSFEKEMTLLRNYEKLKKRANKWFIAISQRKIYKAILRTF